MKFLPAILLVFSFAACAETLIGRVVRVVDGDTVYVQVANLEQRKIRLSGIDAPERGQPFGTKSNRHLSDLVAAEQVTVNWEKRD